ncbi:MAG: FG-GAP repeat protein, partial [Verrucomicrobiota bacterium]
MKYKMAPRFVWLFFALALIVGTGRLGEKLLLTPQSQKVASGSDLNQPPFKPQSHTAQDPIHSIVPRVSQTPGSVTLSSSSPKTRVPKTIFSPDNKRPPGKLSQTEAESFHAAFSAARHAVVPLTEREAAMPQNEGARFFAANPRQQLTARFLDGAVRIESGRGGSWEATFQFAGANQNPLPTAVDNRVEYDHGGGIIEWYENRPEGFEHGFTVNTRSAGFHDQGHLHIRVHTKGVAQEPASHGPQKQPVDSINLVDESTGEIRLQYGALKVFDKDRRAIPAHLIFEGKSIMIVVNDAHANYPLVIDPLITSLESKLGPDFDGDGATSDHFGSSVAIWGDTALIGVPQDDTPAGADAGSCYVFSGAGSNWVREAKINAIGGMAGDLFGHSVALWEHTAAVGAPKRDFAGRIDVGSGYVFIRTGTNWLQQVELLSSSPRSNNEFGNSATVWNKTVVFGSQRASTDRTVHGGSAHVFVHTDTGFVQQADITPKDAQSFAEFGSAVSLEDNTLVVGAHRDNTAQGPGAGSAYVLVRDGGTWSEVQKLTANEGSHNEAFGYAVALSGNSIIIGAPRAKTASLETGAVYVFERSGVNWIQRERFTPIQIGSTNPPAFGHSIALSSQFALVGAPSIDTPGAQKAGAVFVYVRNTTSWTVQNILTLHNGREQEAFGFSVALHENTALVGVPYGITTAGSAA